MSYKWLSAQKRRRAEALRIILCELYPTTFFPKGVIKRPLKIGITEDLRIALPEISKTRLSEFMTDYCRAPSYWAAAIEGMERIDLQGAPSGMVTAEQAKFAKQFLTSMPLAVQQKWGAQHKLPV